MAGRLAMRTVRRAVAVAACFMLLVVLASCGSSSGSRVLPPERRESTTVYVALGGSDSVGDDASSLASVWTQRLFRTAFPRSGLFLDLAAPDAGARQILRNQIDDALRSRPDVVSVTLVDDADRGTDPAVVQRDLRAALDRLDAQSHAKVLVGTIPRGITDGDAAAALDQAITTAAGRRAVVVDLGAIDVRDDGADRQIARRFATALRAS